jgi:hypothetical protein
MFAIQVEWELFHHSMSSLQAADEWNSLQIWKEV